MITIKNKLICLCVLTIVTLFLVFPQKNIVVNGKTTWKLDNETITFPLVFTQFKSYLQSLGLPMIIRSDTYDLHISNTNKIYDTNFHLIFSETDPILSYFEETIGSSTPSIDEHPGFIIKKDKNYIIKNIPIFVPFLNRYGGFIDCGFYSISIEDNCPSNLESWKQVEKNFHIIAYPNINILSFVVQLILIISFWIIIINNALEFWGKNKIKAKKL